MAPSVPDRGSGPGGERVGKRGVGREFLRLSTRQGANARLCADSGPRTSACTDICALACTTNNAPDVSALGDIPGPSLRDRYAQGGGSEIGQAEGGLRAGAVSPTLRVRLPP